MLRGNMTQTIKSRRTGRCPLFAGLAGAVLCLLGGCKGFNINVGTKEAIKLDPIKLEPIDLNMRVDVYQYTGTSPEEKAAQKNVGSAADRLRNRMEEIQKLKNNRFVGENHLGLLEIRNLPAGDYGGYVQKTVDQENADRAFLMTDKVNQSDTLQLADVQREQWERRRQITFEGEWIEVPADVEGTFRWTQKGKSSL